MAILRKCWGQDEEEGLPLWEEAECVLQLERKMPATCGIVAHDLPMSTSRGKNDFKEKKRTLDDCAKVMVLLPEEGNRHIKAWQGPCVIRRRVNNNK